MLLHVIWGADQSTCQIDVLIKALTRD